MFSVVEIWKLPVCGGFFTIWWIDKRYGNRSKQWCYEVVVGIVLTLNRANDDSKFWGEIIEF